MIPELLEEIDIRTNAMLPMIASKQAQYKAAFGIYFQLLPTHSTIPWDGFEIPPDQANDKPHYQSLSGADMGGLPAAMLSCVRIDTYQSNMGDGYVVTNQVICDGTLWERSQNVGPETSFDIPWHTV